MPLLNLQNLFPQPEKNAWVPRCDGHSPFCLCSSISHSLPCLVPPGGLSLWTTAPTHSAAGVPLSWATRKFWQEMRGPQMIKVQGLLPPPFLLLYLVSSIYSLSPAPHGLQDTQAPQVVMTSHWWCSHLHLCPSIVPWVPFISLQLIFPPMALWLNYLCELLLGGTLTNTIDFRKGVV